MRSYLLITAIGTLVGSLTGAAIANGWSGITASFSQCLIGALGASLLGCWIPVGIYYEGHRFRWVYIVLYYLLIALLALVVGHSIAAAAR